MLFELPKDITIKNIKFKEISMSDRELFEDYLEKTEYDTNLWCMNFVYTIGFNESNTRKVCFKIIDDMLCVFVFRGDDNVSMLYPPFGPCDKNKLNKVIMKCMKIMLSINNNDISKCLIRTVNENHKEILNSKYFKCKKTGFGFEHIYDCKAVAELQGKQFEYIRRKVNKFKREFPNAVFRRYTESDWQSMMQLKKAWEETAGEKYFRIIDASYYIGTIKHNVELNHDIFVVELNNRIIGMISGGYISKDKTRAWCFLRKPLNNYDGLSEYLIHMLCSQYKDNAILLNDGGDGGTGGLRFFKERFKPVYSRTMYEVTLNKDILK